MVAKLVVPASLAGMTLGVGRTKILLNQNGNGTRAVCVENDAIFGASLSNERGRAGTEKVRASTLTPA